MSSTVQVPPSAEALVQRAAVLLGAGRAQEALTALDAAVALRPDLPIAHHNRGVVLSVLRRFAEALESFDAALALDAGYPAALNNRGVALQELRRHQEALESFDAALALIPDYGAALGNRGAALRELGRPAEALESCERALGVNPQDISALNNKGAALHELRRLPEAEAAYREVIARQPRHATALGNLGNVLGEAGRTEEALAAFDQALALAPQSVAALENRGLLLNELGRREEAEAAIGEAIRLAPRRARGYYNLASAHDFTPGDAHLAAMEALAADPAGLTPNDLVELNYGLGAAYAGLGEAARAFERFAEGARRKRALIDYDEPSELAVYDRTIDAFSADVMWRGQGVGHPTETPVFVLGMPRSGTTLVEQILAGHPRLHAAGETSALGEIMAAMRTPAKAPLAFPEGYASLHGPALRRAGAAYAERLAALAPEAARVTNKGVGNFRFVGFIHLALPGARIVHLTRDAADTCWSCFSKLFSRDHPYSYDLGEMGRYYRAYERLMQHWRRVLPEGVMLEVRYEDVVADLEGQARRLLEHCGLAWDPACLDFHKQGRQVRTASATQVRKPLYATSVGRWRAYEGQLGVLLEALQGQSPYFHPI